MIYSWDDCPNLDFIDGIKSGRIVWWNEDEICLRDEL